MTTTRFAPLVLALSIGFTGFAQAAPAAGGSAAGSERDPSPSVKTAAAAASAPAAVVAAVQKISNGQAKIEHTFAAPLGLIGMAVNLGADRNMILYASPDGKYMVMGGIFGPDGQNYTMEAAKKYLPAPPPPPNAASNFAALKDAKTFLWGKASAKKEVWMVADPDCIFCHKMFQGFAPFVKNGTLKVNIVMVGFLKPDSLGKAAAIYASTNPAGALIKDETQFNAATEEGGVKPDLNNTTAVAAIKANNAWMSGHGITGTPYILYRNKSGAPAVMPGFAADAQGFLEGVQ